jgi:hypothetical protein
MNKTKRDKLESLKRLFEKEKVLTIEDISKVVDVKSQRTVRRYIKELKYITSYTHKGRYYTLEETAKFNEQGLWHYDDVGFSKHGGLFDTITYFVERSEAGMTSQELQSEAHTVVKYALLDLVEKDKVARSKPNKVYVYVSPNPAVAKKQLQKRQNVVDEDQAANQETVFRVLLAAYQFIEKTPSPEKVAAFLKSEGSKIPLEVVRRILQRYGVEKKTRDFTSSNC